MKKTTQLRNLICGSELGFLMEAHSGLSARIVEEAGFPAIWGSGLAISAAMGVRDNNEASWTQVLETVEFMADCTAIPILLDGDTGYGNFNNMRRLVRKLGQRGIAGVCIEDKLFPKTNSFLRGEQQPLADIDEFCGKIKAGLDSASDDDFCIVARVEAFIAGWGLQEALKRAEAYHRAGATAILIHSKLSRPDEIFSFTKAWGGRCPVVIVPTKYYSTPTQEFERHGIAAVIWANHLLRASVRAMQEAVAAIHDQRSIIDIEDRVVPVKEIFRLQNDQELVEAERRYLASEKQMGAVVLAAGRGEALGALTLDRPKAMLSVNGTPIVQQIVAQLRTRSIKEIALVRGYKKETLDSLDCACIDNDAYDHTGELYSLYLARERLHGPVVISYGDILFRSYILDEVIGHPGDIVVVVDSHIGARPRGYVGDFVRCSERNRKAYDQPQVRLHAIELCPLSAARTQQAASASGSEEPDAKPSGAVARRLECEGWDGEWIGLLKTTAAGSRILRETMDSLAQRSGFTGMNLAELLTCILERNEVIDVIYIDGHWMDVDNYEDFAKSQIF
jgi:phosphoenolpyruvate phosphomutase